MKTLIDIAGEEASKKKSPLSFRMRPSSLDEFVGNTEVIGEGTLLNKLIRTDSIGSLILYGPPGCGKTSLANIIANTTKKFFYKASAVSSTVSDIKKIIEESRRHLVTSGKGSILFLDEIHRFNKLQQDTLLESVEKGELILVGATTENPYFEVNKALLSRSKIVRLSPLEENDIFNLLNRALEDKEKGYGNVNVMIDEESLRLISKSYEGDVRGALNTLELCIITGERTDDSVKVNRSDVKEAIFGHLGGKYDKSGDEHYDTISAFIKSMRGSDPDAALYYLARMINYGEDVKFIARRLIIAASEDVGLADPNALAIAVNASLAVERIGMPEGRIPLAQATLYISLAPKSNSAYLAINKAIKLHNETGDLAVPVHLRDSSYKGSLSFGHGMDYQYPHSFDTAYIKQQYFPSSLEGSEIYIGKTAGKEKEMLDVHKSRVSSPKEENNGRE